MGPVIGIAIHAPSVGVGVALLNGGEVVDAVTLMPKRTSRRASVELAARALRTAQDLLARHAVAGTPLWVIEDLPDPEARTPARNRMVGEADQARAVTLGALLAMLPEPMLVVPSPAEAPSPPDVLKGTRPRGWTPNKGMRREPQVAAWHVAAQNGPSLLKPVSPQGHVRALVALAEEVVPFGAEALLVACDTAVHVVQAIPGYPVPAADELARHLADKSPVKEGTSK